MKPDGNGEGGKGPRMQVVTKLDSSWAWLLLRRSDPKRGLGSLSGLDSDQEEHGALARHGASARAESRAESSP